MAPFLILKAFLATIPAIGQAVSQSSDSTMDCDNEGMVLLQTRAGVLTRRLSPGENQSGVNETDDESALQVPLVSSASNVSTAAMAAAIEALASAAALAPKANGSAEDEMVNVSAPVLAAVVSSVMESMANASDGGSFQFVSANETDHTLLATEESPSDADGAASFYSNATYVLTQGSQNVSASRSQEALSANSSAQEVTIKPHMDSMVAANMSDVAVMTTSISSNEYYSVLKQNLTSNATPIHKTDAEHDSVSNASSTDAVGAEPSEVANISSAPSAIAKHNASSNVTTSQETEVEEGVVHNDSSAQSEATHNNISNVASASASEVTVEKVVSNDTSAQETEHISVGNASSPQAVDAEHADDSNVTAALTPQHNMSANATPTQAANTEDHAVSNIVSVANSSRASANSSAGSAGADLARTPSLVGALQHGGKDCWNTCGQKSGLCDWCGTGNACCRQGWAKNSAICEGVNYTTKKHECVTPTKATYAQEKRRMCGICSDELGLPIGDAEDGLDAATRQTALEVCGALCEQHENCTGFNFEEASGLCRYRRAISCASSPDEGHDCYTKVSAIKDKLWEVQHEIMENASAMVVANGSLGQNATTKNRAERTGGGRSAIALSVLSLFAAAASVGRI